MRVCAMLKEASRDFLADAMASDTRVGIGGWEGIEDHPASESPSVVKLGASV